MIEENFVSFEMVDAALALDQITALARTWHAEIILRCGLDPARYRLEQDFDRHGYRIVKRREGPVPGGVVVDRR